MHSTYSMHRVSIGIIRFQSNYIRNKNVKICLGCENYYTIQPNKNAYDYYQSNIDHNTAGRCRLFGETNILSGETVSDYALDCRRDENKCGVDAKHYTKNK